MGLLDDAIREHLDLKRKRGADPGEVEKLEREALGPVRREPTARSADTVPHLEVHPDTGFQVQPADSVMFHEAPAVREQKRGFLGRRKSAPAPESQPVDFGQQLAAEGHPQSFDHDDPFSDDDPFTDDAPPEHEEAGQALAAEPPLTSAPAAAHVGAEPPPLVLDSPPPTRPTFAPEPPESTEAVEPGVTGSEAGVEQAAPAPAVPPPGEAAPAGAAEADAPDVAAHETREWSAEEAFAAEDARSSVPANGAPDEDVLEETPEFLQDTPDHDRLWFEQRPPRDFDFDG
jgi:hypothetical protein